MNQNHGKSRQKVEPEGRYADRFKIGYRSCVFVIDFDQSFYEEEQERVHTRIVTSPEALKDLSDLIQESIDQYEKNLGPICVEKKRKPKPIQRER